MNRLIFSLLLLLAFSSLKAQLVVKGTIVNELDVQYIELVATNEFSTSNHLITRTHIWIDFGQGLDTTQAGEVVKLVKGSPPVTFRSAIEAINYAYKNGWDLLYQYPLNRSAIYHYILQRRYPKNK